MGGPTTTGNAPNRWNPHIDGRHLMLPRMDAQQTLTDRQSVTGADTILLVASVKVIEHLWRSSQFHRCQSARHGVINHGRRCSEMQVIDTTFRMVVTIVAGPTD